MSGEGYQRENSSPRFEKRKKRAVWQAESDTKVNAENAGTHRGYAREFLVTRLEEDDTPLSVFLHDSFPLLSSRIRASSWVTLYI